LVGFRVRILRKLETTTKANTIQWLPIEIQHCIELTKLPFHHRDPFDRMLIAQAIVEDMSILSCDSHFSAYKKIKGQVFILHYLY